MNEPAICQALKHWEEGSWDQELADRIFSSLRRSGVGVDGALERFLGDEPLYLHSLLRFSQDPQLQKLKRLLDERAFQDAFEVIHLLKGSTATLNLTPINVPLSLVTEYLRYGEDPGVDKLKAFWDSYEAFCQLLEKELEGKKQA